MPDEIAGKPGEEAPNLAAQETAERLAAAIEMHDAEIDRHLIWVSSTTALLGAKLGLGAERVALLRAATPMHDVGKIAMPSGVLHRRDELTPSERKRMEEHTTVGHRILANAKSDLVKMAAAIALTHHECFDGSGYPQGLRSEEIPIVGRITAIADVLDALLSNRPNRPAVTAAEAARLIAARRSTQFDPDVVDALLDNLDEVLALRD